jgi:ubiquinone/menaquinone biosynthesis C-methylase UbiE
MAWNPFLGAQTARGYARARPDYHPQAVTVAARLLELDRPVETAADLGCGTGMSTRALRAIAAHVIGFDVSHPMLLAAEALPGVSYARAAAEQLPLQSQSCDLVAAAAAFHWFDQTATLAEVRRVVRPGGALLAYTDFFSGRLREEPRFTDWLTDVYRQRFPPPPRRSRFDQAAAESFGFRLIGQEPLAHEIRMTADHLAEYMRDAEQRHQRHRQRTHQPLRAAQLATRSAGRPPAIRPCCRCAVHWTALVLSVQLDHRTRMCHDRATPKTEIVLPLSR